MTRKASDAARQSAIEKLRDYVKPGDTLFTILKHVSRSGMSRTIQVVKLEDDQPYYLGYNVALAVGEPYDDKREGVRVGGCGMDMGFHLVYSLSRALFPGSFDCLGETCPANDHFNGDRNREPHRHSDGGYALRQRWL